MTETLMDEKFKTQIFQTPDQWNSGFFYKLNKSEDGGITLHSILSFTHWIEELKEIKNPSGITVDKCGQLYFMDESCLIFRYNPGNKVLEKIPHVGGKGSGPGELEFPGRIIIHNYSLWVLDKGNNRVQLFSLEDFRGKYISQKFEKLVDIGLDEEGNLYVLDKLEGDAIKLYKFDKHGSPVDSSPPIMLHTDNGKKEKPVGLAVGKENILYVIIQGRKKVLRITEDPWSKTEIPKHHDILAEMEDADEYEPTIITADKKGNIFIGDKKSGQIYQFDSNAGYLGKCRIPGFIGSTHRGLAADSTGKLYVSGDKGIALLSVREKFTQAKGAYYSKTLDSGIRDCRWHRLLLDADIPPKTLLKIYYKTSNNSETKEKMSAAA